MAHSKAFVHPPLDLATNQIRLMSIQPGEPICCTLEIYDPADQKEYIALSYTWGPESPKQNIEINGSEFSVRQNLFDFLVVACGKHAGTLFWVDQICINQSNVGERNHQVMRMSRIYEDASCVYAWLGAEADNSDEAMDFIEKPPPANNDTLLQLNQSYFKEDVIGALLDRPYWRRLWIVQEVMLAHRVIVLCGFLQTSFESLRNLAVYMLTYNIAKRLNAHFKSLLAMQNDGYHHSGVDFNGLVVPQFIDSPRFENGLDADADAEMTAVANFRQKIYICRDFECADPRDKIWGLAGLYPGGLKKLQIDYSKTTSEVFWDFFTSHLCGIDHVTEVGGLWHAFPTKYVMEDWWNYAQQLILHMDLDSYSLRVRVAEVLEELFEELQATWLARNTLKYGQVAAVSAFFARKLRTGNVTAFAKTPILSYRAQTSTTISMTPTDRDISSLYLTSID